MPHYTPTDVPELPPLIMSALLDARSFAIFDRLRQTHFPPELNMLPAHLTLFHRLPGADLPRAVDAVRRLAAETPPLRFRSAGTRLLGRGVAIAIDCPPLLALRDRVADQWRNTLTPQDKAPFRPHVTVQNKTSAAAARALQSMIEAMLPIDGDITGLELHHYRGGPWERALRIAFQRSTEQ